MPENHQSRYVVILYVAMILPTKDYTALPI